MSISNKEAWNSSYAIQSYLGADKLQKPEQTILNLIRSELPGMSMLDIGVGAGRTAVHFAPLAARYTGIDYAQKMIDACEKRFPGARQAGVFRLGDVRSMPEFGEESFDFVLFSYNGMDYIDHAGRLKALREINRVLKYGGYFAFSTHNIFSFPDLYRIRMGAAFKDNIYQFYSLFRLLLENGNPQKHLRRPYSIVNDGTNRFSLLTYYINPEAQIKQLNEAGFSNIRLFAVSNGEEIKAAPSENTRNEHWIYFLCEKTK